MSAIENMKNVKYKIKNVQDNKNFGWISYAEGK